MTVKKAPRKHSAKKAPVARKPRKSKAAVPAKSSGPSDVILTAPDSSWTRDRLLAKIAVDGTMANAITTQTYAYGQMGEHCSLMQATDSLREKIRASQDGSTALADELLIGQAVALNATFNDMMHRAARNLGHFPDVVDSYMRLALRAQSQCRSTLESLSKIKNPATVSFVKQANIANGPQQVNNGSMPEAGQATARTTETGTEPIELLESSNGEWVVNGTSEAARDRDPAVEAVGSVDRTKDDRGKGAR